MIVWLASYPRSGNTFFRILLNHLYGIKTPTVYIGNDNSAFVVGKELVGHVPDEWTIEEMAVKPEILFVKTHRRQSENYPAIYLCRDGRDALDEMPDELHELFWEQAENVEAMRRLSYER